MNDLVSYSEKHNEANGEGNRDGDNNNHAYNYGVEGPSRNREIEAVRVRQIKNMAATLLLSQGVPMLLAGDECRRTQRGNNNAYCQDNEISWFDWRLVRKNADLVRFIRGLIEFRKTQPAVRRTNFLEGHPTRPGGLPDVSWFSTTGLRIDWNRDSCSLACLFAAPDSGPDASADARHVLIFFHSGTLPRDFVLPWHIRDLEWRQFVNTAAPTPDDVHPDLDGPKVPSDSIVRAEPRSLLGYVARPS
jgi:isoamylase